MSVPKPPDPPDDADRPVDLTRAGEGSSEPGDWDVEGTTAEGPARPRSPDDVREDQAQATQDDRRKRAAGGATTTDPLERDEESAYTSETEQGASQPGPARH